MYLKTFDINNKLIGIFAILQENGKQSKKQRADIC